MGGLGDAWVRPYRRHQPAHEDFAVHQEADVQPTGPYSVARCGFDAIASNVIVSS